MGFEDRDEAPGARQAWLPQSSPPSAPDDAPLMDAIGELSPPEALEVSWGAVSPPSEEPPEDDLSSEAGLESEAGPEALSAQPLISCIMPTRGRARYVAQAVAYFRRQDYPHRELIIVHDDEADLPPGIEGPDVRIVRATHASIGAKRNQAVALARGEIIAQWDDDDWHAPQRLSRQVRPILQGRADITGLNDAPFLEARTGTFWATTPQLFGRMFVQNVVGGSLVFRRETWLRHGPYPDRSMREDADFLLAAMRGRARLVRLPGSALWAYVRHDLNTWRFATGEHVARDHWRVAAEPEGFATDRAFYDALRDRAPTGQVSTALASCIMPTANRRAQVPVAIRQFLDQDHAHRELIIIDDGEDSVADLIPPDPSIRYLRLDHRLSLGAKRNLACETARGEIIVHWDDDDWRAPHWLGSQVRTLVEQDVDVCGLDQVLFHDEAARAGWRYVYDGPIPWVCGATLCYTKALWRRAPFQDRDVGEDNHFVWSAAAKRLAINPHHDLFVASIHAANTSPRRTTDRRWRRVDAARLERLMGPPA